MINWIKSKLNSRRKLIDVAEYGRCIGSLSRHETVQSMSGFIQHGSVNCLEHSIFVSYYSYLLCKRWGLDYCSAARGGLLHDFFLYDWHTTKTVNGLHGFTHPYTALDKAGNLFPLNDIERDIIVKHMWPLTVRLPKYKESYVVVFVDKYCAMMETLKFWSCGKGTLGEASDCVRGVFGDYHQLTDHDGMTDDFLE